MTSPTLPVSGVVNVQVDMSAKAAALRNFGATLIIGTSNVIDTATRITSYSASELTDIAQAFGVTAPEYAAAVAFFAQSPKPTNVYIGRWAKQATAGLLKGSILTVDHQDISRFSAITNGNFTVLVDGKSVTATGINLSAESNLNGVASRVTEALGSKASCHWDGERFVITSATVGKDSRVSTVSSSELSGLMGLSSGTTLVSGSEAESLTEALATLLDFPSWYSCYVAAEYSDDEAIEAAKTIEASKCIIAFTLKDSAELDPTKSDTLGAKLKAAQLNRTLTAYSSRGEHVAASILGRMSTVNFAGSKTTITLKFKQTPTITPENLRTSQAKALAAHNVNVFVAYDNDTQILQEGTMCGGWYIDERHGLDWLQNYVETAVWNLLYSSKKVSQDNSGETVLVATVSSALEQGVTNGLISGGVWNSDGFGALERGQSLPTGYYVYIQDMDEQSQADREARKAPPIQCAVKLAGAVHFVDVMINVNR